VRHGAFRKILALLVVAHINRFAFQDLMVRHRCYMVASQTLHQQVPALHPIPRVKLAMRKQVA
jgi:hypothetical protein